MTRGRCSSGSMASASDRRDRGRVLCTSLYIGEWKSWSYLLCQIAAEKAGPQLRVSPSDTRCKEARHLGQQTPSHECTGPSLMAAFLTALTSSISRASSISRSIKNFMDQDGSGSVCVRV